MTSSKILDNGYHDNYFMVSRNPLVFSVLTRLYVYTYQDIKVMAT